MPDICYCADVTCVNTDCHRNCVHAKKDPRPYVTLNFAYFSPCDDYKHADKAASKQHDETEKDGHGTKAK